MGEPIRDVSPLFLSRSVAIVGLSPRAHYAVSILKGLQTLGFDGKLVGIHPKETSVLGVPCYPDLASVPFPVDMAVLVVNRDRVVPILDECGRAGVSAATVISSGFSESGPQGRAIEADLVRAADRNGVVLCGPNCLGFVAVHQRLSTYAHPALSLTPGNVAVISHSGGLLNEVLDYGRYRGVKYSYLISAGNEAQVGLADYLNYFVDDPHTEAIGCIVEGVRRGAAFKQALDRALAAHKPVVLIKIGQSELAQQSALTHTGAMAGSAAVFSALARQFGVTQVPDVNQLVEDLLVFSRGRRLFAAGGSPRGMAALEISGGGKGLICDLSDRYGIPLPEVEPEIRAELDQLMPEGASAANPLDLVLPWNAPGSLELHRDCLDLLGRSQALDVVLSRVTVPAGGSSGSALEHRAEMVAAQAHHPDKLFVLLGRTSAAMPEDWREVLAEPTVPYLQGYRRGLAAIGALMGYRRALARRENDREELGAPPIWDAARRESSVLDEVESKAVLSGAGIAVNATRFVQTAAQAVTAADALGYPVVLKGISPAALHKSDFGLVALKLADERAVKTAADTILARLSELAVTEGGRVGLSVQTMVPEGVEIILGGYRDPLYGPVLLCGLGGIWAEVIEDRCLGLAPLTMADALDMIHQTRIGRLTGGFRGMPPFDPRGPARVLVRLGQLMQAYPDIAELDCNPTFCLGETATVADARIILNR